MIMPTKRYEPITRDAAAHGVTVCLLIFLSFVITTLLTCFAVIALYYNYFYYYFLIDLNLFLSGERVQRFG